MHRVGFWSAVIVATAAIAFDIAVLALQRLTLPWAAVSALLPSLVLAPAFLAFLVSVHAAVPEDRLRRRDGRGAAAGHAWTRRPRRPADPHPPDSILNAVDGLGYAFMSLAALFAALVFEGSRLDRWIRRLFLATGILAVPILLTYFVDRGFIYVAGLWGITVPASGILLGVFFRRRC